MIAVLGVLISILVQAIPDIVDAVIEIAKLTKQLVIKAIKKIYTQLLKKYYGKEIEEKLRKGEYKKINVNLRGKCESIMQTRDNRWQARVRIYDKKGFRKKFICDQIVTAKNRGDLEVGDKIVITI